ncbi:hypothetical protein GEMRC1_008893 [Eukaryota sp. GEM-RC1]
MKCLIAIDSFKETLSSVSAGEAVEKGLLQANESVETEVIPLSDGGEGFLAALKYSTPGRFLKFSCVGPYGSRISSRLFFNSEGDTAFIESALVVGLTLTKSEQRNLFNTSTFGLGQAIRYALDEEVSRIVVGLGGTATNDCGVGLLESLGAIFYDENKQAMSSLTARDLSIITSVDLSHLPKRLSQVSLIFATDVTNPLCGVNGASLVYGPQKEVQLMIVVNLTSLFFHFPLFSPMVTSSEMKLERGLPGVWDLP